MEVTADVAVLKDGVGLLFFGIAVVPTFTFHPEHMEYFFYVFVIESTLVLG
jgi:hypothetical protein